MKQSRSSPFALQLQIQRLLRERRPEAITTAAWEQRVARITVTHFFQLRYWWGGWRVSLDILDTDDLSKIVDNLVSLLLNTEEFDLEYSP